MVVVVVVVVAVVVAVLLLLLPSAMQCDRWGVACVVACVFRELRPAFCHWDEVIF
jgi:hypothetical protein